MNTQDKPAALASTEGLGAGAEARQCRECCGKGWNDVWKAVTGHYAGGEVFRETCDKCEGTGDD